MSISINIEAKYSNFGHRKPHWPPVSMAGCTFVPKKKNHQKGGKNLNAKYSHWTLNTRRIRATSGIWRSYSLVKFPFQSHLLLVLAACASGIWWYWPPNAPFFPSNWVATLQIFEHTTTLHTKFSGLKLLLFWRLQLLQLLTHLPLKHVHLGFRKTVKT